VGDRRPWQQARILDAAAIGVYRVQQDAPMVEILVRDDAPLFNVDGKLKLL